MKHRCDSERKEKSVVSFSDAVPDPRTVVVVDFDACAAVAAVEGAGRPVDIARATLVAHDLFSFYHGDVVHLRLLRISGHKNAIEFFLLAGRVTSRNNPRITERRTEQKCQTKAHSHCIETIQKPCPGVLAIHKAHLHEGRPDDQCPREERTPPFSRHHQTPANDAEPTDLALFVHVAPPAQP